MMTKQNGVHCQTSMRMTVRSAVLVSVAQPGPTMPSMERVWLTTPSAGLSIMPKVRPETTGMIASGSMKTDTSQRRPTSMKSMA